MTMDELQSRSSRASYTASRALAILALVLLAVGCSSGGSDDRLPAPSGLSYSQSSTFVVGQAITALVPTVTGTVSSYAVSPSLPAGLTMASGTGVISGTPTAPASRTDYTVTANNASGSATASLSIAVNDVAPAIGYVGTQFTFTTGVPVKVLTPSNQGGAATGWSITPALPDGLVLNSTDGSIEGTPTSATQAAAYVVMAQNSGGQSSVTLTIAVESSTLLELGHADSVGFIRYEGPRALSQDSAGHWVLWNAVTGAMIASGNSPCKETNCSSFSGNLRVDLAGETVVIETPDGLDIRSASTGGVIGSISTEAAWWGLATDGTYICAGSSTGLTIWSPSAAVLASRPGDYSGSIPFAAPGEVRIARGPAGANVVETIAAATGTSTVGPPFQGLFHSWFVDGARFFTSVSTTVWVYSKDGVQQDVVSPLSTDGRLIGQGGWFWTAPRNLGGVSSLRIFAVGASAAPIATYDMSAVGELIASGTTIGLLMPGAATLGVIDLSGTTPSRVDHDLPITAITSYVAKSSSQWLAGNGYGVLVDGSTLATETRYLGFGAALSIAGSAAGRAAVATASGKILYFDVGTKVLEGSIEFPSTQLEMSTDGTVLAAAASNLDTRSGADRSLKIFSLPAGSETFVWPYTYSPTSYPLEMTLSGSGKILGQTLVSSVPGSLTVTRQVTATTGGPLLWSDTAGSLVLDLPILLSEDGSRVAVSTEGRGPGTGTNVFLNGVFVTTLPGFGVGWIDDTRMLVNQYVYKNIEVLYTGCSIYSASGVELSTPALRELRKFRRVSADTVYSPEFNAVFSLTTGQQLWRSKSAATRAAGAAVGRRIVFAARYRVLAEPY